MEAVVTDKVIQAFSFTPYSHNLYRRCGDLMEACLTDPYQVWTRALAGDIVYCGALGQAADTLYSHSASLSPGV